MVPHLYTRACMHRYGAFRYQSTDSSNVFATEASFKVLFADNRWAERNGDPDGIGVFQNGNRNPDGSPLVAKALAVDRGPDNQTTVACDVAMYGELNILDGVSESSSLNCTVNFKNREPEK